MRQTDDRVPQIVLAETAFAALVVGNTRRKGTAQAGLRPWTPAVLDRQGQAALGPRFLRLAHHFQGGMQGQ